MSEEVKPPRRPRTTRLSRKHQATIPVAVLAEAGVQAGERLRHVLAISALTYVEILMGPLRAGGGAVEVVERFAAQVRIVDLSPAIARLAAELRATRGLKLPDAVIVATGLRLEADVIVTADARWKGIPRVVVVEGQR